MATQNQPTQSSTDQLLEQIAKLRAENARLEAEAKAKSVGRITLKATEKGGLSVYGLGRFPVTLYREQWERLLGQADAIKAAVSKLPTKAEKGN